MTCLVIFPWLCPPQLVIHPALVSVHVGCSRQALFGTSDIPAPLNVGHSTHAERFCVCVTDDWSRSSGCFCPFLISRFIRKNKPHIIHNTFPKMFRLKKKCYLPFKCTGIKMCCKLEGKFKTIFAFFCGLCFSLRLLHMSKVIAPKVAVSSCFEFQSTVSLLTILLAFGIGLLNRLLSGNL